jgi:hypothetical protein
VFLVCYGPLSLSSSSALVSCRSPILYVILFFSLSPSSCVWVSSSELGNPRAQETRKTDSLESRESSTPINPTLADVYVFITDHSQATLFRGDTPIQRGTNRMCNICFFHQSCQPPNRCLILHSCRASILSSTVTSLALSLHHVLPACTHPRQYFVL